jgi:hypothetical protein
VVSGCAIYPEFQWVSGCAIYPKFQWVCAHPSFEDSGASGLRPTPKAGGRMPQVKVSRELNLGLLGVGDMGCHPNRRVAVLGTSGNGGNGRIAC